MSSDELFKRAMNELEVSFLLSASNLEENLKDPSFVCNQMQLAHYRYIDFWRKNHPELPEIKKLEVFLAKMFEYSTIFCGNDPAQLVKYYSQYKSKIPVCGCILLNKDLTKIVLCRNINGECWMAPAGKINEGETLAECAVRETYEESGFDATNLIDENQCLPLKIGKKMVHMFIIPNVPDSFIFGPTGLAKNEIDLVRFFPLRQIPSNSFRVTDYMPLVEKWIAKYKKDGGASSKDKVSPQELEESNSSGKRSISVTKASARSMNEMFESRNVDTFEGNSKGWSVKDMFATVENAIGRSIDYDGNSRDFEGHPMYRNYNAASSSLLKTKGAGVESFDFEELSKQSSSFDNFKKDEKSGKIEYNTPFSLPVDAPPPLGLFKGTAPAAAADLGKDAKRKVDISNFKAGLTASKPLTSTSASIDIMPSGGDQSKFISINDETLTELLSDLKACYSSHSNKSISSFESLLLSQLHGY